MQGDRFSLPELPEPKALGQQQCPIYNIPFVIRPKPAKFRLEARFSIAFFLFKHIVVH